MDYYESLNKISDTLNALIRKESLSEEEKRAIEYAIGTVSRDIPKDVVKGSYEPNTCPHCGGYLGGEDYGDGYYENPYYDRCPYCGQKLNYPPYTVDEAMEER